MTLNPIQRIARNSAAPIAAQLINKGMDLGFALVVLRILGAAGNGAYEYAVLVWLYVKTIADFGLGVLTTRDVAREPGLAGQYLGLTTLLRLGLWLVVLPAAGLFVVINWRFFGRTEASTIAVLLLLLSIVPDSWSDAANAICNAREEMVAPALLTMVKNAIKVGLGLVFLLAGWGVIGLAATALLTNLLTAWLFTGLMRRLNVQAVWDWTSARTRRMLREAWPLLVNNLLAGLFFSVDVFVLGPTHGDAAVGVYRAPYKFLNLLLLVPQYGTLALFPHLSRLAAERSEALASTYALAIKLLLTLALPLCMATLFVAPDLMLVLAGAKFLPDAGIALRLLIWFLPFSYVNGLTQYVLIAAGLQRYITPAFAVTFSFNLGMNFLFTPHYGYQAAATITVLSEVVLLLPFLWLLHQRMGALPPPATVWPLFVAAVAMVSAGGLIQLGLRTHGMVRLAPWVGVVSGGMVYVVVLLATGGIGTTERRLVQRLLGRAA